MGKNVLKMGGARDFLIIILGITLYSLGFTLFVLPHDIVIGGMAGFSTLVYYATSGALPVAAVMYGMNGLLLLMGARTLGKSFLIKTIFGATLMSLEIGAMEGYFMSHAPLIQSVWMSVGMGGVLMGLGIGMYYSHGGTAGGTDIIAAMMSRRSNVSMGRVMMIVDMSIVALSFLLPFDGDLEARVQARTQTIMIGWLAIFVYSFLADRYIGEGRQTVQMLILSDHWDMIANRITHEIGRGVTVWDCKGYWTGTERKMMIVWCRKDDMFSIYSIIKAVDSGAYVTSCYVTSIFGNGFDHLHFSKVKKL